MSHQLSVQLSDAAFAQLQLKAAIDAKSPAELASAALEQQFRQSSELQVVSMPKSSLELQELRERFERHFGEVDMGSATGVDNEGIDADLAREYADSHGER